MLMAASSRMTLAADFDPQALLAKPLDEIKAPVSMPLGTYVGLASKYEFKTLTNEKKTTVCTVTVIPTEAMPDVDADQLKECLGDEALTAKELKLDFFITPEAVFRVKEWGNDHCKIGEHEAANTAELLELACDGNHPFGFEIGQVPNKKNPEKPYHQITRTFALP